MLGRTWELQNQLNSSYEGLSSLMEIQIQAIDVAKVPPLHVMLPPNDHMPMIGSFMYQCYNHSDPFYKCGEDVAVYNMSHLKEKFHNVQSLVLFGVSASDKYANLSFPWNNQSLHIPLNMTRSSYEQQQYTGGVIVVPSDIFVRVFSLSKLSKVDISTICPLVGIILRIDMLDLNLNFLPQHCFRQVKEVSLIDLSYNQLERLNEGTFQNLHTLEQLFLGDNSLHYLSQGLFDDLIHLKLLDLHGNCLAKFPPGMFAKLESLETLLLSDNRLTMIESRTLPVGSPFLRFVDFRDNSLQYLPEDCLTLPGLEKCDCDQNNITLDNLEAILERFNPILLDIVAPRAYYGEPFSQFIQGVAHDIDQTEISLQNNSITSIPFSNSWSL